MPAIAVAATVSPYTQCDPAATVTKVSAVTGKAAESFRRRRITIHSTNMSARKPSAAPSCHDCANIRSQRIEASGAIELSAADLKASCAPVSQAMSAAQSAAIRQRAGHGDSGEIIGSLAAYGLIIAAVLLEGMAQLAFKRGTSAAHGLAGEDERYWRRVATSPWIAAGVALYVAEILCWIGALHDVPLSIAFPALALNYVVVVLGAHWLLGEPVDRRSTLAIGLIVAGVTLVVAPAWPA